MQLSTVLRTSLITITLFVATSSHGSLVSRGRDSLGNQLIYDNTLNVTWYDYSHGGGVLSYADQSTWVNSLNVNFNGSDLTDWRLPTSSGGDWSYGYDGSTTAGFNITTSEMGNLYYLGMHKIGAYNTFGEYLPPKTWLNTNFNPFENLMAGTYFTGTVDSRSANSHYYFYFYSGYQFSLDQSSGAYAIAVRNGDVSPVSEPSSISLLACAAAASILFGIGRKKCPPFGATIADNPLAQTERQR